MTNTSPILTIAELETIVGGAGIGFPGAEAGQALGMGIEGTFKAMKQPDAPNIGGAINNFNQSGWNPVYNAIQGVGNYFQNNAGSTYTPASMGANGSITPGSLTPPGQ